MVKNGIDSKRLKTIVASEDSGVSAMAGTLSLCIYKEDGNRSLPQTSEALSSHFTRKVIAYQRSFIPFYARSALICTVIDMDKRISQKERIIWVDVVKYICIIMVMLSHMEARTGLWDAFYSPFFLSAFFFVSGYVYRPENDFKGFLKKIPAAVCPVAGI